MPTQPQVFISYQRTDETFARQVRKHLLSNGVPVWMDQYDIPAGAYWPDAIDAALVSSNTVIGILSPDAVESRNVKNEWDWALQNGKPLILLQVAPCLVPHRYVSINFVDATSEDPANALAALSRALGIDTTPHATPSPSEPVAADEPVPTRHAHRVPRPAAHATTFLAGREREQKTLRTHLDQLMQGHGSLVLIGGEAGIGKTTLTNWLAAEAESRGAVVLSGGCYDLTTTPPYGPWGEIVRHWPDDARFPRVPAELRGGEAMARLQSQAALFELVTDLLATAGTVKPLVLLLEDLHWADQASLDLLRYLARLVGGFRLLLVATYRDDEVTRHHPLFSLIPTLAREPATERLVLQRLAPAAMSDLITSLYRLSDAERDRLTSYVTQTTEGNPFFAREVLRVLEDVGVLSQVDGGWRVSDVDRVLLPQMVRQVIEGRLQRLGDETRRLLEIAAVIGHEVDLDVWIDVSGADEESVAEALELSIEAHLLEEMPDQPRARFVHALVRETLYAGLVSLRRRNWHRRCGDVLVGRARPDPDVISAHYQLASDPHAAEWLIRAGERAQLAYAWSAAVERYESALALLTASDSDPLARGWLQYRIARLRRFRQPQASIDYLEDALRIAIDTQDQALHAAARFSLGLCRVFAGEPGDGINDMAAGTDLLEALSLDDQRRLGLEPDEHGTPTITNPRGFLVVILNFVGRISEARHMGEATREALPRLAPLSELGWSHYGDRLAGLGNAYAQLGLVEEASVSYEHARARFLESGHYSTLAAVTLQHLITFGIPYYTDRRNEIERLVAEYAAASSRAAGATGLVDRDADIPIRWLNADWDGVVDIRNEYELSLDIDGQGWKGDIYHAFPGRIAQARGNIDEAWWYVNDLLPHGYATDPGQHSLFAAQAMQLLAADLALNAGDMALAEEWLKAHDHWLAWSGAVLGQVEGHLGWARYHRETGDLPAAEEQAQTALAKASDPRQPLGLLAAHRLLGELATDRGDHSTAQDHLRDSLTLAERYKAPYEVALTQIALANLHLTTGEHDEARDLLASARETCERLGAQPALERIAMLETRLA
jgi:tetratricopeptide (TPR) repeat protein